MQGSTNQRRSITVFFFESQTYYYLYKMKRWTYAERTCWNYSSNDRNKNNLQIVVGQHRE